MRRTRHTKSKITGKMNLSGVESLTLLGEGRGLPMTWRGGIRATCNGGEEDMRGKASLVFDRSESVGDVSCQGSVSILGKAHENRHTCPLSLGLHPVRFEGTDYTPAFRPTQQLDLRPKTISSAHKLMPNQVPHRTQETVGAIIFKRTDHYQGNR